MGFSCSAFGLGLHTNLPIAGLSGLKAAQRKDVRISLGAMPSFLAALPCAEWREYYVSPEMEEDGLPGVRVWRLSGGEYFRIEYHDGTVIAVNAQGSRVWASWPDGATVEDTATYLLGPTVGFVLRLRGITCLHASAVVVEKRAIALVGPAGSGKSTMAAAFARLGHAVLTDDVLALADQRGRFMAQPAYPRVRLWPESVTGLFGSEEALPRITPGWDKRYLDLCEHPLTFERNPLPLAAIYFLDEDRDCSGPIRIKAVTAQEGLMLLVANTYANYLLDKPMRANEFEILSRLVKAVSLRRVTSGADFAMLPELCRLIAADSMQVTARECTA